MNDLIQIGGDTLPELIIYKSIVVFLLLFGLFIAESYFPSAIVPSSIKSGHRKVKNISLWLCNSAISPFVIFPITLYAVGWGFERTDIFQLSWPVILLDVVILDFWIYWWHKANHRLPFLWRFHQVHHLDQWLDVTSAVRFHFGEVLLSALVRAAVIVTLGIPLISVVVFETLVLLSAGFHHSNLKLPVKIERGLSKFIITPSIHWVHHHNIQKDTDSNYGTLFSFWDRMFSSQSKSRRNANMVIGIEGQVDKQLGQLLLLPFVKG